MKYKNTSDEMFGNMVLIVISILILLVFLCALFVSPYFEAKSFNRISGCNVGYWDAFFTQLRFDGDGCK